MKRKKTSTEAAPTPKGGELVQRQRITLKIPNASGIALLGTGLFLVVDDDDGIFTADASGEAKLMREGTGTGSLHDLEGISIDVSRSLVLVVAEKGGSVQSIPLTQKAGSTALGTPESLGKLPSIGKEDNKGWEGISWVPAGALGPDELLLAVHERKPKRLGVFSYPGLETQALLELPQEAKDALRDLSDIAFDPETRRIWILSDESRCLVALVLKGLGGETVSLDVAGIFPLKVGKREKPEGVCVDADRLWLVTDGEPYLYEVGLSAR